MQKRQCFLTVWSLAALLTFSSGSVYAADAPAPQAATSKVQGPVTKVSGTVVDEIGEGIPGASVKLVGSSKGVITDIDGSFSIDVPKGSKLEITFLGYTPYTLEVDGSSTYKVELHPQSEMLDEVVSVAFGRQKKESVIGAISTIDASSLKVPVGNLSSAIAGKIAGAVVMQRTSEPGSSADFWIRGVSSFGANNRPLVLVDGIERSMDLVDPEDIQSFSILKDATATALYGVRGANGIVLITTKRGVESKPKVSAKVEYGFTDPVRLSKMANTEQWIDFYNDINLDYSGSPYFSDYEREMYLSGADPDLYPSVDWIGTIFKDQASTTRVNVSVSGGTPAVRYYVGGSFYTEGSILDVQKAETYDADMRYTKYNFRANVDINITKSTELGLSLANLYATKNRPGSDLSNIYVQTLRVTPIATPIIFSDGTLALTRDARNPWWYLNKTGYAQDFSNTSQSLLSLTQDFSELVTPGLKANVKFAWDAVTGTTLNRHKSPAGYYATGRDEEGELIREVQNASSNDYMTLSQSVWSNRSTALEASVTYDNTFNSVHYVSAMFNFNMRSYTNNLPGDYITAFPKKNTGIAGRATYNYDNRYFVEFNFGYNGSENFSPKKRFGFFPSYAIGYLISNEKFWEPITPVMNLLKLKASYGEIGNDQIGGNRRFAFNTTMKYSSGFNWGTDPKHGAVRGAGLTTGDMGNDDVSWEKAVKKNIGVELGFFNSALTLNVDYFYEKRSGIFIQQESVPTVVGNNTKMYVNLGRMTNRGLDMTAEFNKKFGEFFVSARGTFTYNRNKKEYDDKPTPIYPYLSEAGFAYGQARGLVSLGLFESQEDIDNSPYQTFGDVRPGDIKYKDINGDNIIDSNDMIAIGYSTYVPEISYGFGTSLTWKGIDFSVFFQGVAHSSRIIGGQLFWGAGGTNMITQGQIFADVAEKRWTLENPDPNAEYPRQSIIKPENNTVASTYWLRDMDFLRLKNAEVGYTFPKKWFTKTGISNVRIYVTGNNLLTFSNFKLWDPESYTANGELYPQVRTIAAGLNVNF